MSALVDEGVKTPVLRMDQAPKREFWLDELRLREFPRIRRLIDDPEALRHELAKELDTDDSQQLQVELEEQLGASETLLVNLLLVASFLNGRKSAAVEDVAGEHLPVEVAAAYGLGTGLVARLALTLLLCAQDLRHLASIDLWDRWHSRRRCVLEIEGHARAGSRLGLLPWEAVAEEALGELRESGLGDGLAFRAWLPRRGGSEVLVAFREPSEWVNVRTESGEVVPGREDGWTLLLFYEGGSRVDITGTDLDRARVMAGIMASRVWRADVSYRPVRRPLREKDLSRLLARLTNPEDDVFRLLEIVAQAPHLPNRPFWHVGNSGQQRIEKDIAAIRRKIPFAYEWKQVRTVKIGFHDKYRITLHFPAAGDDLVVTYSDIERNKEVSRAFERLVADELGVVIAPKVARHVSPRGEPDRPKRLTPLLFEKLIGPVLDEPAQWMVEEVERLERDRLVRVTRHSVLRCGAAFQDPSAGGDTLDCPGEIEMPHGLDLDDPWRQSDSEHTCSHCGRLWRAGRQPLPLFLRLRIEIDHGAVWSRCSSASGRPVAGSRRRMTSRASRTAKGSGAGSASRSCISRSPPTRSRGRCGTPRCTRPAGWGLRSRRPTRSAAFTSPTSWATASTRSAAPGGSGPIRTCWTTASPSPSS